MKPRNPGNINEQELLTDAELSKMLAVSIPTARDFADEHHAVIRFGRARRTVKRKVLEALNAQE